MTDEALDLLLVTGFRKAVHSLTLDDSNDIKNALLSYHLIAKVKAELDQFIEGLHTFDFLSLVKADPETWKIFFVYAENRLTPGKSTCIICELYFDFVITTQKP